MIYFEDMQLGEIRESVRYSVTDFGRLPPSLKGKAAQWIARAVGF